MGIKSRSSYQQIMPSFKNTDSKTGTQKESRAHSVEQAGLRAKLQKICHSLTQCMCMRPYATLICLGVRPIHLDYIFVGKPHFRWVLTEHSGKYRYHAQRPRCGMYLVNLITVSEWFIDRQSITSIPDHIHYPPLKWAHAKLRSTNSFPLSNYITFLERTTMVLSFFPPSLRCYLTLNKDFIPYFETNTLHHLITY